MDWDSAYADSAYADEDYGISLDDERYSRAPVECRQDCRCPRRGHARDRRREGFVGAKVHDPEERAAVRAWRGASDPEGDCHYGGYPYNHLMPPRYADDTPYSGGAYSGGAYSGGARHSGARHSGARHSGSRYSSRESFVAGGGSQRQHPAAQSPVITPQTLYFMLFILVLVFLAVSLACLHRISALEAGIATALGTSK